MTNATEYDAVPLDKLIDAQTSFQIAALNLGAMLTDLCGGDIEEAKRQIRLALDLPASVIAHEARAAEAVAMEGAQPTVFQIAAMAARIISTVNAITATLDRKQAGASLQ